MTIEAIKIEKILDKGYASVHQIRQMRDAGYNLLVDFDDKIEDFRNYEYLFKIKLGPKEEEIKENKLIENENQELIYRQILEANQMILAYVENIDTRLKAIEGKFL